MPLLCRRSALPPVSARMVLLSAFMAGLCATGALFFLVSRLEARQEELRFRDLAQRRFTAIRIGTEGALAALQGVNQLFAAMGTVSGEQFRIYTRPMLQAHPYLVALGFQRIVPAQERAAYEARMRLTSPAFQITELAPGGSLVRAGNRATYRVIEYIEPLAGNEVVVGMDSGFLEIPSAAAQRAAQLGLPTATALFGLPQYKGMKKGFLVLLPVYAWKTSGEGTAPMRVAGYNAAVFLAEELFARILAPSRVVTSPGLTMSVHSLASDQMAEEVFRSTSTASDVFWLERHVARLFGSRPLLLHEDIDIAGSAWRLTARTAGEFLPEHHAGSLLVLLLGLASTLSAAGYLRKLNRRTLDLAHANAMLNRDIAERHEIAQALSRSEDRFRRLVELSSDWYWEQDAAYRFSLLAGRKVREAPGMLARVIGRTRWEVALSADPEDLAAHRALVERHQPFQNFEYLLTLNHGQQVWLSVNGEPFFNEDGQFAGYRGTGRDISQRKRSEQALRELTAHRESIKEQERKRIAREIHDELGQTLLALRLDVASLHLRVGAHIRLRERVGLALSQIDFTIRAVRNIINDLRPPVLDLGLDAAIEWQVGQFQRRSGIHCHLAWNSGATNLDERVATALFRIVQEALTNVLRHAGASAVTITLGSTARAVNITIADNGRGAQPEDCRRAGSFGLAGISERVVALGGKFDIVSEPGSGLTLLICLPLQQASHAHAYP
ncbi:MAG: CHASE domain-containing protein [Burkholderiaceae bacterium]